MKSTTNKSAESFVREAKKQTINSNFVAEITFYDLLCIVVNRGNKIKSSTLRILKDMFTAQDLNQFAAKGIDRSVIERQLEYFGKGFPFLRIDRPASVNDGIRRLTEKEADSLEQVYEKELGPAKVLKFVPASGAATRMFKDLFEFVQPGAENENASVKEIFDRLSNFAFYNELKRIIDREGFTETDKRKIAAAILHSDGLSYGSLPKGMLLFHKYADDARTALEEHLAEGAAYARNADGSVNLHFTVSPEHREGFETLVKEKAGKYAEMFGVHYNIGFSQQKPSTDTIAVDSNNEPMRSADGKIVFRPGGHGALLENLNEIDADIIFIKNIDNVVPDRLKPATVRYKKVLAGLLIDLRRQAFEHIRALRSGVPDEYLLKNATKFLSEELSYRIPEIFNGLPADRMKEYLLYVLDRPMRVCGMVRNEGEPGGGPFWVRNADGSASLQIAESSQIDMNDPHAKEQAAAATHFNPVDLVCAVKNCDGERFDLLKYRDPDTGFISVKSKDGVALKAQELPGLWNGAMAHWNTIFVEVPGETFNPVKTINDLLRPQHQ